jgi:hypothetical protein
MTQHDSYYGDWIGPAAMVAKQKKQQTETANPEEREIRSDGDAASLAAISNVGIADRRDHSAPPQTTRRESVSTAPTNTNTTDYTNNTNATSVDGNQEVPKILAAGVPYSTMEDDSIQFSGGVPGKVPPELLRPKTDSIVAIDMKIPGRYPPTNVAA